MKLSSKERLQQILDYLNLNANELAKAIALKRTQNLYDVLNEKVQISGKLASKLNECFPQLNMRFMLTGEGPMTDSSKEYHPDDQLGHVIANALEDEGNTYISKRRKIKNEDNDEANSILYIPIAAQAGYQQSYQDPLFIRQLQRINLPGLPFKGSQYRLFEVEGDSMDPTLKEGYQVVAQFVEPDQWQNVANYYIYVIVTSTQILIKRLFKLDDDRFVLISDNDVFYPQMIVSKADVNELWLVKRKLDWDMPPPKRFEINVQ